MNESIPKQHREGEASQSNRPTRNHQHKHGHPEAYDKQRRRIQQNPLSPSQHSASVHGLVAHVMSSLTSLSSHPAEHV